MNIVKRLIALLTGQKPATEENLVEAEMCPNCWGKQEYEDEYRDITKERLKAPSEHKAFVEQFMETHLTGIKLKQVDDKLVCPHCDGVYKNSPTNAN